MRTIKLEDGKKVKISEESYKALSESIKKDYKIDNNTSLVDSYKFVSELSDSQIKIKTTEKRDKQIYVNEIFADESVFGSDCIFIKCKFGSDCEFDSDCVFDSYCVFKPYCRFGSNCEFNSNCIKR